MWHHNKHLIGYFEFLHGSRIICLPLNIPKKLHWQYVLKKLEKTETHRLHFINTLQYPRTLKSNIYHSNEWGLPLFLHVDTSPATGHALVDSVDKTRVLVVTVNLIWLLFLNIVSLKFVATPNNLFRFTRFISSYVNHPALDLTN